MFIIMIVFAVIPIVLALWFMTTYNGFVRLRNMVKEGWSGVDVQLKRRYDLIPNIVETVKGYAKHESEVFENVTKARTMAINAGNVSEQNQAENMLTGALKSMFAVAEDYPELKANENFKSLQDTLNEVEDDIQKSRRYYNGTVRDYNIKCESFPSVIIANMFKFEKEKFFEAETNEKENVHVKFGE
ncbi:MAG: hypothetical protein C0601_13605 [Candidatus Muiribacterium halophilum]|uniref:LemA family protein n=1 Tax=Muiribacterium halophilum TaxID=2053465 RepID=A0A2N5Z8Z2_MUIH1|nr:MAG: hypothetical protein C0601_13605 [Candidatus Muirbacterium halophilum]